MRKQPGNQVTSSRTGSSRSGAALNIAVLAIVLFVFSALAASAVCRAATARHEGRLYDAVEAMGVSASAFPVDEVDPDYIQSDPAVEGLPPVDFLNMECGPSQAPLPAALWAGLMGGAGVLMRGRRARAAGRRRRGAMS